MVTPNIYDNESNSIESNSIQQQDLRSNHNNNYSFENELKSIATTDDTSLIQGNKNDHIEENSPNLHYD